MYTSDYPQVSLPKSSVWHYQFPSDSPFDRALPAYIDGITGRTLSRGDVHDDGLRLLSGLRALGVKRGDTACLWGLNSLPWIQAAYGCMAAGVTVSPANYAFSAKELAYQINNSDSSVIFLDASLVPILDEARPQINIAFPDSRVVLLCETKDKPVPARYRCVAELFGAPGKAEVYAGDQVHDTIWMCYSSGTTGFPKGVMSTQHNFTSQLQALKPAVEPLAPGDKMIGFVPLSHTYGTTNALLQPFSVGAACVILPRFEEIAFLRAIERVSEER
jgi:long-subunit acyl-CoA synthetase (AMP-forming)